MNDEIIVQPPQIIEVITEAIPVVEYKEVAPPTVELWMTAPGPKGDPGEPGLPGPKGDPGSGAASYVHTQDAVSTTWVVNHNLNKCPAVVVLDSAGTLVYGDIQYNNDQMLTITFSVPFSGKAHCN
jgi:hypothetical protein